MITCIEKLGNLLAGFKTLFLIDDIIADETLDKKRQPLLELAISGRHKVHSIWLLMQSNTTVSKNIWRQAKMLYIWHPNTSLLSRLLQHSYQETTLLLSRNYVTPIKKLRHSYQETTALLSILLQHYRTHISKNDRILEFYSPMYVSCSTCGYYLLPILPNEKNF